MKVLSYDPQLISIVLSLLDKLKIVGVDSAQCLMRAVKILSSPIPEKEEEQKTQGS